MHSGQPPKKPNSNSSSNLPLRTRASMKQLKQHNKLNGSGVSSSCVTSAQCTAHNTLHTATPLVVPHKTVLLQAPPQNTHKTVRLLVLCLLPLLHVQLRVAWGCHSVLLQGMGLLVKGVLMVLVARYHHP